MRSWRPCHQRSPSPRCESNCAAVYASASSSANSPRKGLRECRSDLKRLQSPETGGQPEERCEEARAAQLSEGGQAASSPRSGGAVSAGAKKHSATCPRSGRVLYKLGAQCKCIAAQQHKVPHAPYTGVAGA